MRNRGLIVALALAGCIAPARAQMYRSITDLGYAADIVAFASVIQASETGTTPNLTLSVQLRFDRVIKGQPSSQTAQATLAEKCYAGGSGPMHLCVRAPSRMAGMTGLWFLKSGASGYEILPCRVATHDPDELFLSVPTPSGTAPSAVNLDDLLLAYEVQWIQSLNDPPVHDPVHDDERFFSAFDSRNSPRPSREQLLSAIAPLIASPISWQHAVGLVIALRADSVEAMTQVVNELATLQSNPRFPEIVGAIGGFPANGAAGSKDLQWIVPLRQFLALRVELPGMDAATAAALYRVGTPDTWPLLASLLDSKDANAQIIVVRAMALRVPPQLASDQTRRFYPGGLGQLPEYVAFWKSWWNENRASLGFSSPH